MLNLRKITRDEQGSATIEFLAMVPLVLFLTFVFIQFLMVGYSVIITQSALNEASKVYATTGNTEKAEKAAKDILSTSGKNVIYKNFQIKGNTDFTATIDVELNLIFIPDTIVTSKLSKIPFDKSINSRVIE